MLSRVILARAGPDIVVCGHPKIPPNGIRKVLGTTAGSVVEYSCKHGFELVGHSKRFCLRNGRWSGSLPVCRSKQFTPKNKWTSNQDDILFFFFSAGILTPLFCPNLAHPGNGKIRILGNKTGDRAYYTCDKGFYLVGNAYRTCLKECQWSGKPPVCKCECI